MLPIISLQDLATTKKNKEHKRLLEACTCSGFFYLSDHGIPQSLIKDTISASKNFFNLPFDTKTKYSHEHQLVLPKESRGYVPAYGETLSQDVGADNKECFDIGVEKAISKLPFTGPNFLPTHSVAPNFSRLNLLLQSKIMENIVPTLIRSFALCLDLPADYFDEFFKDPTLIQRIIYYGPGDSFAGKHTDNGFFTILLQENLPSPSLKVYTKGKWIDAHCLENTFVVNLGDILQHWTNKRFISTPHSVKHKLATDRISLPFFIYPDIDAKFTPLNSTKVYSVQDIMLKNFDSIWVEKTGAGRAREL